MGLACQTCLLNKTKEKLELVGQEIIHKQGSFEIVKNWYKGWHPEVGKLINGWSGKETEVETTRIMPIETFEVKEDKK